MKYLSLIINQLLENLCNYLKASVMGRAFALFGLSESLRLLQQHVTWNNFLCMIIPCTGNLFFVDFGRHISH